MSSASVLFKTSGLGQNVNKYVDMEMDTSNSVIYSTKSKDFTRVQDIEVKLNASNNRRPLPEKFKDHIDDTWQKRLATNLRLFNGTKFRLDTVEEVNGKLRLNLGITCYKDFQGTNLSEDCLELQSQGLADWDNCQAYISDVLGVGALLYTADDKVVLLYRSAVCGEDRQKWDRPGGHPEPKTLVGPLEADDIDVASMSPEAVLKEIFDSVICEVVSEINLEAKHMEEPRLIGIHRSHMTGGKPNMEFFVRCSLTSKEIESLYLQGSQPEAFESEQIKFMPIESLLNLHKNEPTMWDKLAVGGRGMLLLYNMYKHRFL